MTIYQKKFPKIFIISIFYLFISSCDCIDHKQGINVLYIYDISGSFHTHSLDNCINLGNKIFKKLIAVESIKPQIHQVNTISELSISHQNNCYIEVKELDILSPKSDQESSIKYCHKKVLDSNPAPSTDISGALLNASLSLEGDSYLGKILFVFSDFKETANLNIKSNLENIIVIGIQDFAHDNNEEVEYDKLEIYSNKFKTMLLNAGCKNNNMKIFPLRSALINQNDIMQFIGNRLKSND